MLQVPEVCSFTALLGMMVHILKTTINVVVAHPYTLLLTRTEAAKLWPVEHLLVGSDELATPRELALLLISLRETGQIKEGGDIKSKKRQWDAPLSCT